MAAGAIVVSAFEVWWDIALIEGLWFCDLCKETAIKCVLEREYVSPKTAAMGMNLRLKSEPVAIESTMFCHVWQTTQYVLSARKYVPLTNVVQYIMT
jgi:hypothetical protein